METCAVVVLNWNGVDMLREYLPHIIKYTPVDQASIVVADNASTDGSVEFVQKTYPQVHVIKMSENTGFAGGYNKALQEVEAKYYLLLNSDVEVTENWLDPLIEMMSRNEQVWACSPKLLDAKRKNYFEYAGASGGFIDYLGYPYCRGRIFNTIEEDQAQYNDTQFVFWASGAALMIRSAVFHRLGGFDQDYFSHMEEIDLCWRIKSRGGEVAIVPQSKVYHLGGASLSASSPYKTYLNFRNNLTTLYKNQHGARVWWYLFVRVHLDLLASFVFLLSGQSNHAKAALKGHWHFWKYRSKYTPKRNENKKECLIKNPSGILRSSIIWLYQIRKRKFFSEL